MQVGQFLCNHPLVDSIHLTGSEDTFNSIVYGSPKAKVCVEGGPCHGAQAGRHGTPLGCMEPL